MLFKYTWKPHPATPPLLSGVIFLLPPLSCLCYDAALISSQPQEVSFSCPVWQASLLHEMTSIR